MVDFVDRRRTDQRANTLENPYWISSAIISNLADAGKNVVLFSFPKAGEIYLIQEVILQNIVLAVTGTTVDIGSGTIPLESTTTGGVLTVTDLDEYFKQGDYAVTAATFFGSTTGNTSDWLSAKAAGTYAAPRILIGAAGTVPVIYATVGAGFTAGTFRVHVLLTRIPGV